jgi:hypothetical protein
MSRPSPTIVEPGQPQINIELMGPGNSIRPFEETELIYAQSIVQHPWATHILVPAEWVHTEPIHGDSGSITNYNFPLEQLYLDDILHIPAASNEAFGGTISTDDPGGGGAGGIGGLDMGPRGLDPDLPYVSNAMTRADNQRTHGGSVQPSVFRGRPLPAATDQEVADISLLNMPPTEPVITAHNGTNGSAIHHTAEHRRAVHEVLARVLQQLPLT